MAVRFGSWAGSPREENRAGGDVMERKEAKEVEEVKDVKHKSASVAAFFDLDGTLMRLPSLEKRFFSMLRYRKLIGFWNYILWIAEAVRLMPRGINRIMYGNKMYLRGVRVDVDGGRTDIPVCPDVAGTAEKKGLGDEKRRRQARMPVPLFPEAIERVEWHAERGHLLVIVSGMLEFLAERAAHVLEAELGARGLACTIRVCATRLEEKDERWTGRVVDEAMFGEAKVRAIRRIAEEEDLDLRRCFAYGDSASDKWMLEAVGKPAAVNPSNDLQRIARRNDWAILQWGKEKTFTQRAQSAQRALRKNEAEHELQVVRTKAGIRA
jgi:HAD superfamily phosphoserine phosphatase-like hydrolase